jgi:hypothetical protein
MSGDKLIEFEEQNWDWLIDRFLEGKIVRDMWEEFVYNEYEKSLQDPPDMEDR